MGFGSYISRKQLLPLGKLKEGNVECFRGEKIYIRRHFTFFFLRELKDFTVPAKLCPAVICRVTELFDCFLSSQLSSDVLTDAMFI